MNKREVSISEFKVDNYNVNDALQQISKNKVNKEDEERKTPEKVDEQIILEDADPKFYQFVRSGLKCLNVKSIASEEEFNHEWERIPPANPEYVG